MRTEWRERWLSGTTQWLSDYDKWEAEWKNEWLGLKDRGLHWNSFVLDVAQPVPALQCPPSPHIPKHLIRPTGTIVQDPLVAFSRALSPFHFVDETWHLARGLFLFLGLFNQSCLCGLLPVASKNTEPDLSLRSLLLDTVEGSRSWECKSPRLWRKPGLKVSVCGVRGFTAAGARQGSLELLRLRAWVSMTWHMSALRLWGCWGMVGTCTVSWHTFYWGSLTFACSPFCCWPTWYCPYFSGLPELGWSLKELLLKETPPQWPIQTKDLEMQPPTPLLPAEATSKDRKPSLKKAVGVMGGLLTGSSLYASCSSASNPTVDLLSIYIC